MRTESNLLLIELNRLPADRGRNRQVEDERLTERRPAANTPGRLEDGQ
jgi:hypothetical protein